MNKKNLLLLATAVVLVVGVALFLFGYKKKLHIAAPRFSFGAAAGALNEARNLETKGLLLDARNAYQKLIGEFPNSREVMNWQKKVDELNIKLLFSTTVTPGSVLYEIKPGDTLTKIAREFKTTIELIAKSNNLGSGKIFPGQKIKVWTAPFGMLVYKSQNILILKSNEEIIKTYIVATGKDNCTPAGNFKIVNKLTNPTWFKAGAVVPPSSPENILGSRWLGFDLPGYGIHGTIEPQNLGRQVTAGCIRMANSDVEELYTIVPTGTDVAVVE